MSGIRMADIPDIKHIAELAEELHANSAYSHIKPDEQKFKMTVAGLIANKLGQVYVVVDNDNVPQGFLLGLVEDYFFSRQRYATDIAVYIREKYARYTARLYKKFITWASTKPRVVDITFAHSSGKGDYERWKKLMYHLGLEKVGSVFMLRVEPCQDS